jgi:hypothetical protein
MIMKQRRSHAPGMLVLLGTLAVATAASAQTSGSSKPIVAVFDIENQGTPLAADVLDRCTGYLTARLAASGRFDVVPRSQMKARLSVEKKKGYKKCYDQSCQIEIGKELAAEKSVAMQIMKIGSQCIVSATLYDLRKATTEQGATAKSSCGEDAVLLSLDSVVTQLTKANQPPTPPPRVATAAVSPKPVPKAKPVVSKKKKAYKPRRKRFTVGVRGNIVVNGNSDGAALAIGGGGTAFFNINIIDYLGVGLEFSYYSMRLESAPNRNNLIAVGPRLVGRYPFRKLGAIDELAPYGFLTPAYGRWFSALGTMNQNSFRLSFGGGAEMFFNSFGIFLELDYTVSFGVGDKLATDNKMLSFALGAKFRF